MGVNSSKEQRREYDRLYREKNRDVLREKKKFYRQQRIEHYREMDKKSREKQFENEDFRKQSIIRNCKYRAKAKNIPFDLDWKEIEWPTHCPILNVELDYSRKPWSLNSPSVDRIDNSKGYLLNNCKIVSLRGNRLKSDFTEKEILLVLNYMRKNSK